MKLSEVFSGDKPGLSFELFPPKTDAGMETLYRNVGELASFNPDFFTCTYGAGGSTREKTLTITTEVKRKVSLPVASHLTCVGSTKDELRGYLTTAIDRGVDYIVALRGDPPHGETSFKPVEGGLRYANELVELIKAEFPQLGILVAGYPEVHQEAPDAATDLENLKRKVDAGADAIVTQLFYDNADFFAFRDKCVQAGITVPIIPGLLPVLTLKQVQRITSLCKAKLPKAFVDRLSEKDDNDWQFQVGVEHATAQMQELLDASVAGLHFYVLNKATATRRILSQVNGFPQCQET